MKENVSTQTSSLKQAFKTFDDVMQEVALEEEQALEIICSKLRQENTKLNSPAISAIIGMLSDWGKVPASEILERVHKV